MESMMALQLADRDRLAALLAANGIDLGQWGVGAAKGVDDLWQELCDGEAELYGPPLLRVLRGVVQVIVRSGEAVLIEAEQVLRDGRVRQRNAPPADKMRPGESYAEAALRCLEEELGIAPSEVTLLESSYRRQQSRRASPSYPGLPTQYTFHVVEAQIAALPTSDFWTDESAANLHDAVGRHHWVWRAASASD